MNWNKLFAVARWEFIEKVRTKAFVIGLFLGPVIGLVFSVLPTLLASRAETTTKRFAVYDETNTLVAPAQKLLTEKYKLANGKPNYELVPMDTQSMNVVSFMQSYAPLVFKEEFIGLVVIPKDVETSRQIEYRSDNVGNERDIRSLRSTLEEALIEQAILRQGMDLQAYKSLSRSLETKTVKISKTGEAKESGFLETFGLAYGSALILMLLIITSAQILVRGLVEEKSNRIMEILVSSCSPFELMMGKLVGLSGLGIVQAGVWVGFGIGAAFYFGAGIPSALFSLLPIAFIFTILGYVFFASLLLGLGSLANTDQEGQQIFGYIMPMLALPFAFLFSVMQNPNSTIAKVLSYIPFTAPTVMTMRVAVQMPPVWEIALSIAVLVATIILTIFFAAKIFRVAILSYGKRPTLPEIISFLREPS